MRTSYSRNVDWSKTDLFKVNFLLPSTFPYPFSLQCKHQIMLVNDDYFNVNYNYNFREL